MRGRRGDLIQSESGCNLNVAIGIAERLRQSRNSVRRGQIDVTTSLGVNAVEDTAIDRPLGLETQRLEPAQGERGIQSHLGVRVVQRGGQRGGDFSIRAEKV